MRTLATMLAGAAALGGCATQPSDPPMAPVAAAVAVDPDNPLFAPAYLALAASGDQFELRSADIAHPRAQAQAVHVFATMLTADHTRSSQTLGAAAQSAGLMVPPPSLMPAHQALLDQLTAAGSGPAFDIAFRDIQIQAHQQALTLHQNYAASGDVPALRAAAAQIVPVIQAHLQQLQGMALTPPPALSPPPSSRPGERG